jgi:uncharacterized protein
MRIKRWLRNTAPQVLAQLNHPALAWAKPMIVSRRLFAFTRRGVARGVAIGLIAGAIPGPLQVLSGLGLCVALRANVVAAVMATCYTNPFTIVPIYWLAHALGRAVIPGDDAAPTLVGFAQLSEGGWMADFGVWVATLGKPLIVGLPLLAVGLAVAGYFVTQCMWTRDVRARVRGRLQKV